MLPNLDDLLKYKNENILLRYQKDYPHAKMPAHEALSELLKYIWLCCKHALDFKHSPDQEALQFSCIMHEEMIEIDYMWHTFLLFTRDYLSFCQTYLSGDFFHHQPKVDKKSVDENNIYELQRYLAYIYDQLGEDTLTKWFKV